MNNKMFSGYFFFILIIFATNWLSTEAQKCNPSGQLRGKEPPPGQCNQGNDSECCKKGKLYPTYTCSPQVSKKTKATLTINSFQKGGDGGGPSECDNKYHSDKTPIVALLTGWYNKRSRLGCDAEHDYQPPCPNNVVDASNAIWKALGVSESDPKWGFMDISWSDAQLSGFLQFSNKN
ncbi:ripening-related protein 2 [Pyrus ussuriensis x Pyrus communis]|uniref:Ripening-related protein 2 n=1 Tax=Pyrus ussuriensis x Pyrus communis TaxID=2448454 RepID=A0A5N5EYG3_9ROSA|nr:ripening-related protein 2 [Pyrus ussuriensis x Pyrus communis]